jgi:hypothetical protein
MVKSLELLLCIWRFWTQILAQRPEALLNKPYIKIVSTPQIIEPKRMKSKALVAGGPHTDLDFQQNRQTYSGDTLQILPRF